jgi:hypothetical protein
LGGAGNFVASRGDPRLARFETWLDQRLTTLQPTPEIHTPIEQFARGYTPNAMNIHAARATIPVGSYPATLIQSDRPRRRVRRRGLRYLRPAAHFMPQL